jgi:hypothetical protein
MVWLSWQLVKVFAQVAVMLIICGVLLVCIILPSLVRYFDRRESRITPTGVMPRWLKVRLKEQQCGKPAMMIALRKTILRRRSSDHRECPASRTSHL